MRREQPAGSGGGRARRACVVGALLVSAGCRATHLGLQVRVPGEADASAAVRLVVDEESACSGGVVYTGRSDATGALDIQTEACGRMRLVVSRQGKRTVEQLIDTCELRGLEVVLWPAPPPRVPADPCAQTAHAFLQAWAASNEAEARALWAGSRDFARHALEPSAVAPWAIDVEPGVVSGDRCRVRSQLSYEHGCEDVRALDLARQPEGWRVLSFERAEP